MSLQLFKLFFKSGERKIQEIDVFYNGNSLGFLFWVIFEYLYRPKN